MFQIKSKIFLSFLSLFFLTITFGQFNKSHSIKNNHLDLNFSPESGIITLNVLKENSEVHYSTEATGLYLDGILQNEFEIISEDPPVLQNKYLNISFEILNDQSIAVSYLPNDGDIHQFEFHLKSDDVTEYYGMGERFNSVNQRGYILPSVTDDRYGVTLC